MPRIAHAAVLATLVVLALVAAAAAPPTAAATQLSVRVAPATVQPGGTVTVSGKIAPKLSRATDLAVQLSPGGKAYSTVKTLSLRRGARAYATTVPVGTQRGYLYLRVKLGRIATPGLRLTVAALVHVAIKGSAFAPATATVSPWTTVLWTNNDAVPHTVTAADSLDVTASPTGVFDSGPIAPGAVFGRLFVIPGTYFYLCALHSSMPSMHAQIVVQ